MPSKDDHLSQARHNARLYDVLDRTKFSDWAATVLFYECLHYVDAFLAVQPPAPGIHPGKHFDRDNWVQRVKELRLIWQDYRALKDGSRNGRYNPPTRFSPDALERFTKNRERIKAVLGPHVPGLIPPPGP